MKKQYVSPVCGILNLPVPTLMTGSLDPEKGSQSVTPDPDEPSPNVFTTRRQSAWADEEEE